MTLPESASKDPGGPGGPGMPSPRRDTQAELVPRGGLGAIPEAWALGPSSATDLSSPSRQESRLSPGGPRGPGGPGMEGPVEGEGKQGAQELAPPPSTQQQLAPSLKAPDPGMPERLTWWPTWSRRAWGPSQIQAFYREKVAEMSTAVVRLFPAEPDSLPTFVTPAQGPSRGSGLAHTPPAHRQDR